MFIFGLFLATKYPLFTPDTRPYLIGGRCEIHPPISVIEQVDYKYTSDEQESGLAKLVEAAVAYDATGPASLGLGAFQVRKSL